MCTQTQDVLGNCSEPNKLSDTAMVQKFNLFHRQACVSALAGCVRAIQGFKVVRNVDEVEGESKVVGHNAVRERIALKLRNIYRGYICYALLLSWLIFCLAVSTARVLECCGALVHPIDHKPRSGALFDISVHVLVSFDCWSRQC